MNKTNLIEGLLAVKCHHILNVATGITYKKSPAFILKTIEILDVPETKLGDYFQECFDFIDKSREDGGCLVHCNAGVSRSASVCIAYLMYRKKMRFADALELTKSVKKDVRPNDGFMVQLKLYDEELFGGEK